MVTLSEPQLDLAQVSIRFSPSILKILVIFSLPKLVWLHIAKVFVTQLIFLSFILN
jgi:hypothetical protein